jgi:hypothetical protein
MALPSGAPVSTLVRLDDSSVVETSDVLCRSIPASASYCLHPCGFK